MNVNGDQLYIPNGTVISLNSVKECEIHDY